LVLRRRVGGAPSKETRFQMRRPKRLLQVLTLALPLAACTQEQGPPQMPEAAQVEAAYGESVTAEVSGNLLRLTVPMPQGFERGGSLWARSGPYFYLFTTATRDLFVTYPDLAAVEVVARTNDAEEVSRARLLRGALNEITWQRAIAYASRAQTEGTESPRHVDQLVRLAEDHTEYEYNPDYVPR
jgi:hypothetical protein